MKKCFIIINHKPTEEQLDELRVYHGVTEFCYPDAGSQWKWANISPDDDLGGVIFSIQNLRHWIRDNSNPGDYIWVQGEPTAQTWLVHEAITYWKLVPIFATTRRESVEKVVDGKTVKTNVFKHVRFRKFDYEVVNGGHSNERL